ncbi:hypothetical protein [Clostridium formicaceticum]|uniref:Uncharacterized protein n=1 Tax=Clostridium formicaceticum TaxID=1497 RepID=A0AAC9RIX9_9CLOT|nr:hypothetical protein [Clostridium formicaceticum]ARE86632.1 hypothetical protein CLFO_09580 [Clostridium formicaceticum]
MKEASIPYKEVIKEKYLEIISHNHQVDSPENAVVDSIAKATEMEGLIRDIAYYEEGQN